MHHFDHIMKNANVREDQYKYRMHWGDFEKHGLILNNRSGTIDWVGIEEADIKSLQGKALPLSFLQVVCGLERRRIVLLK